MIGLVWGWSRKFYYFWVQSGPGQKFRGITGSGVLKTLVHRTLVWALITKRNNQENCLPLVLFSTLLSMMSCTLLDEVRADMLIVNTLYA